MGIIRCPSFDQSTSNPGMIKKVADKNSLINKYGSPERKLTIPPTFSGFERGTGPGLCGIAVPEIPDSGAFSRNFVPDRIPDFLLQNPEF